MPNDNVATIRELHAAYARGDAAALLARFSPDVEIRQSDLLPWGGVHRGHAGAQRFLALLVGAVSSRFELERAFAAGDHGVAVGRTRGTARASGRAFDVAAVHVYAFDADGRVARYEAYVDTPAMLAALGERG